jgi:hypothetical protein
MVKAYGMRAGLKDNAEEALRLFSSESEWSSLNLAETEFVLEETLKCYGSTLDGDLIRSLFRFYRRYVGMSDVGRRQGLLSRLTAFVSDGRQNRSMALLCFLSADRDGQIISGAALDLAMVMPIEGGDPLTGPRYVAMHGCGGIRARLGASPADEEGDAAAGLLLLGDMRLMPLLEEVWERLTPEARRRMVQRRSNLVSALMVEFLLRRLEADKNEEYHGELGAALHNLPEIASQLPMAVVMDIRRNFGLPAGKEPMELLGRETLAEAFARMRPRLEALIARESEPKVLPNVLAVWVEAAESEVAQVDEDGGEAVEEKLSPANSAKKANSPQYRGVMRFIYGFVVPEAVLIVTAIIWALCCAEWVLLLALLGFTALNFIRVGALESRVAWSRWLALGLYGLMLWHVGHRIHQHNLSGLPSGPAFLLLDVLVLWFGPMFFLNLICFDYAKQMRDAPDKAD